MGDKGGSQSVKHKEVVKGSVLWSEIKSWVRLPCGCYIYLCRS